MKKYFSYSIRKLLYDQFFIRKSCARAQTHRKYAFTFDNSKSWNREQKSLTNVPKIRPIIVCLHTDFWNDFREIGSHFCWMCVKFEWISRLFLSLTRSMLQICFLFLQCNHCEWEHRKNPQIMTISGHWMWTIAKKYKSVKHQTVSLRHSFSEARKEKKLERNHIHVHRSHTRELKKNVLKSVFFKFGFSPQKFRFDFYFLPGVESHFKAQILVNLILWLQNSHKKRIQTHTHKRR